MFSRRRLLAFLGLGPIAPIMGWAADQSTVAELPLPPLLPVPIDHAEWDFCWVNTANGGEWVRALEKRGWTLLDFLPEKEGMMLMSRPMDLSVRAGAKQFYAPEAPPPALVPLTDGPH